MILDSVLEHVGNTPMVSLHVPFNCPRVRVISHSHLASFGWDRSEQTGSLRNMDSSVIYVSFRYAPLPCTPLANHEHVLSASPWFNAGYECMIVTMKPFKLR